MSSVSAFCKSLVRIKLIVSVMHDFFGLVIPLAHHFGDWYSNAAPDFGWAGQRGTGQIREKVKEGAIGIGIAGANKLSSKAGDGGGVAKVC
jgi:hypothetical protein